MSKSSKFNAFVIIGTLTILAVFAEELLAADGKSRAVHDYGKSGDDPATETDESAIVAGDDVAEKKQYRESTKFAMIENDAPVSIYNQTRERHKPFILNIL